MKRIIFIIICLSFFSCSHGPHPTEAVEFNDGIVFRQDTFYIHLDELLQLIKEEANSEIVTEKHKQLFQYTEQSLKYYETHTAFDKEDELRLAAVEYFSTQLKMLNNEFSQLIKLYSLPVTEIDPEHDIQWDSLMNALVYMDSVAVDNFLQEQKHFADKYGITLKEIDGQ